MIIWPLTWHRFETTKIYSKQSIYLVLLEHCGKSTLERCGYGELLTFIWTFLSQTKCIIVDTVSEFIKPSSFTNSLVQHVVNFHEFSIFHQFFMLNLEKTIIGTFCTQKLVNFYKDLGTKSNVYIEVTFCTQKLVIFKKFCTKSNVYIVVTFCTQILVIAWFLQESGYKK